MPKYVMILSCVRYKEARYLSTWTPVYLTGGGREGKGREGGWQDVCFAPVLTNQLEENPDYCSWM
jgi:hypothetical protein